MNTDISLMLQVKEENLQAFERLYQKYQKPVVNFFYRLGCDLETSEDYVQEVFMRLWKARKTYEPQAKFTTFLFQIAKNYWINETDKKRRRPVTYHIETDRLSDSFRKGEITDAGRLPQDKAIHDEMQQKIREAIASLKEIHRITFVLSEIQGLKYREIADILEIPIGTVKSRMAIAEKQLRSKLAKYFGHDDIVSH